MELKRFFINGLDLKEGNSYKLEKEYYNYMINVIRLKLKDEVIVCNNSGLDFLCKLELLEKNEVTIKVIKATKNLKEAEIKVTLFQALVKNDKLELILQKITELGLVVLQPFSSKFTVVKKLTKKLDRLDKIAENASRQCGRAKMVKIESSLDIKQLPELLNSYDCSILAYEKGGINLKKAFENKSSNNLAIIIGSEGGFSQEEIDELKQKVKNLYVVGLGNRILRAETASIALSAICMHELGELN